MGGEGMTASDTLTDTRFNGLAYLYNQGAIGSGADAALTVGRSYGYGESAVNAIKPNANNTPT